MGETARARRELVEAPVAAAAARPRIDVPFVAAGPNGADFGGPGLGGAAEGVVRVSEESVVLLGTLKPAAAACDRSTPDAPKNADMSVSDIGFIGIPPPEEGLGSAEASSVASLLVPASVGVSRPRSGSRCSDSWSLGLSSRSIGRG